MNDSLRDPRRNADTFPCSYVGKRETWKDSSPVVTFNHEILLESISRLFRGIPGHVASRQTIPHAREYLLTVDEDRRQHFHLNFRRERLD